MFVARIYIKFLTNKRKANNLKEKSRHNMKNGCRNENTNVLNIKITVQLH